MNSFIKSNSVSEQLRQQGNKLYKQTEYREALKLYNKALCYVEKIDSKEAAFIFGNRSAVYSSLELPEKCIENIEMARNAGYPADKAEVLETRLEKCKGMLTKKQQHPVKDSARNFFNLSYPAHEKTPFVSSCIEMRVTKKYGRGLYATRDLKAGDVITNDNSNLKILGKNGVHTRCTNCVEMNSMSLIPCPSCVGAMYCSKKCLQEAYEVFHQHECRRISILFDPINNQMDALSTMWRSYMKAKHAVGGLEKLMAICNDKELHRKTFFDYDLSKEDNKDLELNQFLAAMGLVSVCANFQECSPFAQIGKCIDTSVMQEFCKSQREKNFARQFLLKTYLALFSSFFENHRESKQRSGGSEIKFMNEMTGSTNSLLELYMNHNCSPNVFCASVGTRSVYFAIQPIKKDEQIFITLFGTFQTLPKVQRQKFLLNDYRFNCDCTACEKDWPLQHLLPIYDRSVFRNTSVRSLTIDEAVKEFKNNCQYTERNFHRYPSGELCFLRDRNNEILTVIAEYAFDELKK